MTERLGIPVKAVGSAEEAVRGAHSVSTATTSKEPVLDGTWLEPGMHINAIGVNQAAKRELDTEAVLRSDFIAADSREQSKIEAGDLIHAFAGDASRWETVHEFADVVAGKIKARTDAQQITLFKSNGVATEDIVVAGEDLRNRARAETRARRADVGEGNALAGGARSLKPLASQL